MDEFISQVRESLLSGQLVQFVREPFKIRSLVGYMGSYGSCDLLQLATTSLLRSAQALSYSSVRSRYRCPIDKISQHCQRSRRIAQSRLDSAALHLALSSMPLHLLLLDHDAQDELHKKSEVIFFLWSSMYVLFVDGRSICRSLVSATCFLKRIFTI